MGLDLFDFFDDSMVNGGKTLPFLPPMTGNGLYHIKIAMTGGWFILVLSKLMDVD